MNASPQQEAEAVLAVMREVARSFPCFELKHFRTPPREIVEWLHAADAPALHGVMIASLQRLSEIITKNSRNLD
ncbi:MAG: hypothetical protein AAGA92_07685 [Planctomycetota bacterium]